MKQIVIVVLMACSLGTQAQNIFTNASTGQQATPAGLHIGDAVPNLPMAKVLINDKMVRLNTQDYKDKLLVLYFWATYCSPCIETFPKLTALQQTFGDKLQVIAATFEKEETVRKFKGTNAILKAHPLPILVEDTLMASYFPYKTLSHTVWINKGKVIAITTSDYATKEAIGKVLNGEKINLPVKDDFLTYDFKNASLLGNRTTGNKGNYSIISGYNDSAEQGQKETVEDPANGKVKDVFLNMAIPQLYMNLVTMRDPWKPGQPMEILRGARHILEVKNSDLFDYSNYVKKGGNPDVWFRENAVSYESVLPNTLTVEERATRMMADLDAKLGLHGRTEMRSIKVWTIKPSTLPKLQPDEAKDGKCTGKGGQFTYFYMMTAAAHAEWPPLIDESGIGIEDTTGFDSYAFNDFASLKRVLNINGLDLVEEVKTVKVFVLSETGK